MQSLNVLICGSDEPALQRMAQLLVKDGIQVGTSSQLHNCLGGSQRWDLLLVDLDGLNSFLRMVLPGVRSSFPDLPVIGISTKSDGNDLTSVNQKLNLDACLNRVPRTEDLIVAAPHVAARFLCDTKPLG